MSLQYRKKILVNKYERLTHEALKEAVLKHKAKVYPKIRVADVLELNSQNLSQDEIFYGMKAHFDFTIAQEDDMPVLAVEFDGDYHQHDYDTVRRDRLKNSICDKLEMPLLRINSSYLRWAGNYSVLGWLIELAFMFQGYIEAERRGEVLDDFDWYYGYFLPYRVNNDGSWSNDLDPFFVAQSSLAKWYQDGIFVNQIFDIAADGLGYEDITTTYRFLELPSHRFIVGKSTCQFFQFPAISSGDASREIASLDAIFNYQQYKKGKYTPLTPKQTASLKQKVNRLREYRIRHTTPT